MIMMKNPLNPKKKLNSGFTIIESMITGLIILVVIAGLSSLLIGVKRNQVQVSNISDARAIALKIIRNIYARAGDYPAISDVTPGPSSWASTYVGCYTKAGEFRAVGVGYADHYSSKDFVIFRVFDQNKVVAGVNSQSGQTACNYKDGYEVHISTVAGCPGSCSLYPDSNARVTIIPLANNYTAQTGNLPLSIVKFSVPISSPMSPGIYEGM